MPQDHDFDFKTQRYYQIRILIYYCNNIDFKAYFCFIWSEHWFYEVQIWLYKVEIWFNWLICWFSHLCEWLCLISLWFYCGYFCCFSFLSGHYFVDVVMAFLTTNAIFPFPFDVHLLLTILVSSQCQYCFSISVVMWL